MAIDFRLKFKKTFVQKNTMLQGIRNMGNTCYIAAIIQALRVTNISTPGLLGKLLEFGVTDEILSELKQSGWNPNDSSDVAEFLQHVAYLSIKEESSVKLTNERNELTKKWHDNFDGKTKVIAKNLFGQFAVICACSKCKHKTVSSDIFIDLPIATAMTDLNCALESMFHPEEVNWTCEKCNNNNKNTKTIQFERVPQVLILRFLYKRMNTASMQLDIGKLCTRKRQGLIYGLRALICLLGDHYITIVNNDGEWIMCDDESIRPVKDVSGFLRQAYMLIYQNKKIDFSKHEVKRNENFTII